MKIGQGRDATKAWLRDNDSLRVEITDRVKEILGLLPAPSNGVAEDMPAEV
ncbi:MAG: hypothetical protein ACO3NR_09575 [Rhodothermales bacterium]